MNLFLLFVFGFSISFMGMIFPSMLNMTTVKINVERGKSNATRFALGASLMVFFQAFLAILLNQSIHQYPNILMDIQSIAIVIFGLLSIYFFMSYRKDKMANRNIKKNCRNTFIIGILLSGLNMFAIPFYYGITQLLRQLNLFELSFSPILFFITGSTIGSFFILYLYPSYFKKLVKYPSSSNRSMNLFLASVTGLLSIITLIRFF